MIILMLATQPVKCKRLKTPYLVDLVTGKKGKAIFAMQSPYQLIEMILIPSKVKGKKKWLRGLFLNGEVQYVVGQNKEIYHNAHAKILRKIPKHSIRKVAILGGGDGVLAGKLAKLLPKATIYVLELDPCMIYVFKKYFPRDNDYAFYQRNVKPIIGDAFENIKKFDSVDLVFVDLPDALDSERLEALYSPKQLGKVFKRAKFISIYNGGVDPAQIESLARKYGFRVIGRGLAHGWLGAIGFISHLGRI